MPFQIIRNDITKVKADAIVNTANPLPQVGDGVDSAIYEAAGFDQLLAERKKIGELPVGKVAITSGFNLDAKYIIHSSGPMWRGGSHNEAKLLKVCYYKSLMLAYHAKCKSIAFPLMATGTYGFPNELGLQIAVDAFKDFLEHHEMDITLVVFNEYAYKVSGDLYNNVVSYIDRNDVEARIREENASYSPSPKRSKRFSAPFFKEESELEEAVDSYEIEEVSYESSPKPPHKENIHLESLLKSMYTDSFENHLRRLINKKGLTNSEVYSAANISKQYFSKLLKGKVKPSKNKVLALAIGLHLNLDETIDFLKLAGYALSPISQTDVIVKYFIENKDYNVMKIDIVLFDYGLDPLSKG